MNLLETIFASVLDLSWRCSWVLLLVFALRPWLSGRIPARIVFWIWIAISVRLLLPVSVPTSWSPFSSAGAPQAQSLLRPVSALEPAALATDRVAASGIAAKARAAEPSPATRSARGWLALVWGAGVLGLLAVRIGAYARFRWALQRSHRDAPATIERWVADAGREAGLGRLAVCVTDAISLPALHGIFRPQLLFPPAILDKLSADEARFVIAHELSHARRRDLLAQAVLHAAAILHWFNPLVWYATQLSRRDCELACDETVLRGRSRPERASYGATLLRLISLAPGRISPPAALGVVESKHELKRRLALIVDQPASARLLTILGCGVIAALLVVSLTRGVRAEPPAPAPARATQPAAIRVTPEVSPQPEPDPAFARLNALFPDGIVARVDDRVISVDDIRRDLLPLIGQLRQNSADEQEFQRQLEVLQNDVVANLVTRILLIKQFRQQLDPERAQVIAPAAIDRRIEQEVQARYGNDHAALLADLARRGMTPAEYRQVVEEELIYRYMRSQQRQVNRRTGRTTASPAQPGIRATATDRTSPGSDTATPGASAAPPANPDARSARGSVSVEPFVRPIRQPRT